MRESERGREREREREEREKEREKQRERETDLSPVCFTFFIQCTERKSSLLAVSHMY